MAYDVQLITDQSEWHEAMRTIVRRGLHSDGVDQSGIVEVSPALISELIATVNGRALPATTRVFVVVAEAEGS